MEGDVLALSALSPSLPFSSPPPPPPSLSSPAVCEPILQVAKWAQTDVISLLCKKEREREREMEGGGADDDISTVLL